MCEICFQKECCEFCDTRKNIVFKDRGNKQEYRIINSDSVSICKIKVDNCLISSSNRCDYLAIKCAANQVVESLYFIELKGSDLKHALVQIEETIKHSQLKTLLSTKPKIYARIVLNKQRTPDIKSSEKIRFEKMIKRLGGNLKTQGKKMTEELKVN